MSEGPKWTVEAEKKIKITYENLEISKIVISNTLYTMTKIWCTKYNVIYSYLDY